MTTRTYTRRSREQWQQHILDQPQSGLSIAAYCQQHDLAVSNFYTWRSKLRDINNSTANTSEDAVDSDDWLAMPPTLSHSSSQAHTMALTLSLPGGITLTIRPA